MMQTEVEEVYEPFAEGRGSSSTMPQKRNPISSNYIHACVAMVRQHVAALLDAMVEDHERSTGPWEIEWIVVPEIFCLAAGALAQARFLLGGPAGRPGADARQPRPDRGLVVSEAVMMGLGPALGRQRAHDLVYDICREVIARPLLPRPAGRAPGDRPAHGAGRSWRGSSTRRTTWACAARWSTASSQPRSPGRERGDGGPAAELALHPRHQAGPLRPGRGGRRRRPDRRPRGRRRPGGEAPGPRRRARLPGRREACGRSRPRLRINALRTPEGLADLAALLAAPGQPDYLLVPKAESADELRPRRRPADGASAARRGWWRSIESARGLAAADAIARATPRLAALMLGAADLAADLGRRRRLGAAAARTLHGGPGGGAGRRARHRRALLRAARRRGAAPPSWRGAAALGFAAKAAIHPAQVGAINAALTPSPEAVEEARRSCGRTRRAWASSPAE